MAVNRPLVLTGVGKKWFLFKDFTAEIKDFVERVTVNNTECCKPVYYNECQ